MKLDPTDLSLLQYLQEDSKQTNKQLSSRLNLSVTAVYERIKKLERNGVIKKYTNYSNQIGNNIKNSGFQPMDKIEFINQIEKNQESLKSSVQEIFKNVDLYRVKVENVYNNKFINDSIYNFKLIVLNDMNVLIEKVEKANKLLLF